MRLLRMRATEGRLSRARHEPDAPPLETDPVLFRRALGSLLRNALEATPPGGTVDLTCEYEQEVATISVHNDGVIHDDVECGNGDRHPIQLHSVPGIPDIGQPAPNDVPAYLARDARQNTDRRCTAECQDRRRGKQQPSDHGSLFS